MHLKYDILAPQKDAYNIRNDLTFAEYHQKKNQEKNSL